MYKNWLSMVCVHTKFHKNGPFISNISGEENTLSPSRRKFIVPYTKIKKRCQNIIHSTAAVNSDKHMFLCRLMTTVTLYKMNDTALSDAKTVTWDSNPTRITDVRYIAVDIVWWDDPTSRDFHQMSINENHTNIEREILRFGWQCIVV
jgi:hypothetical protein